MAPPKGLKKEVFEQKNLQTKSGFDYLQKWTFRLHETLGFETCEDIEREARACGGLFERAFRLSLSRAPVMVA
jgi:hypothetical protein